jgi:ubiquinol oxidase
MTYPHDTMENLKIQHFKPEKMADWAAFWAVQWLMLMINLMSGFYFGPMTEIKWLRRTFLMETVSLIPGMVGSICRYLRTLRMMKRDRGWIHHLL